jgi:hypothetical protein
MSHITRVDVVTVISMSRRDDVINAAADLLREAGPDARLARTADNDGIRDDLGDVLRYRLIAGWASFVIDMNDRVGLPFPTIELDDRIFDE